MALVGDEYAAVNPERVQRLADRLQEAADTLRVEGGKLDGLMSQWGVQDYGRLLQDARHIGAEAEEMAERACRARALDEGPTGTWRYVREQQFQDGPPETYKVRIDWDVTPAAQARQDADSTREAAGRQPEQPRQPMEEVSREPVGGGPVGSGEEGPVRPPSRQELHRVGRELARHARNEEYVRAYWEEAHDATESVVRRLREEDPTVATFTLAEESVRSDESEVRRTLSRYGTSLAAATRMAESGRITVSDETYAYLVPAEPEVTSPPHPAAGARGRAVPEESTSDPAHMIPAESGASAGGDDSPHPAAGSTVHRMSADQQPGDPYTVPGDAEGGAVLHPAAEGAVHPSFEEQLPSGGTYEVSAAAAGDVESTTDSLHVHALLIRHGPHGSEWGARFLSDVAGAMLLSGEVHAPESVPLDRVAENAEAARILLAGQQGAEHARSLVGGAWLLPATDNPTDAANPAVGVIMAATDESEGAAGPLSHAAAVNVLRATEYAYGPGQAEEVLGPRLCETVTQRAGER